jgi:hypothetical protein
LTTFLRLLRDKDKATNLLATCTELRTNGPDRRVFQTEPDSFRVMPGTPFAYWVSDNVLKAFRRFPVFETGERTAQFGVATKDDFRFLRLWWEVGGGKESKEKWRLFSKGGAYSLFYADVHLCANWAANGQEIEASLLKKYPYLGQSANWVLHRECHYFKAGVTWTYATTLPFSARALPSGCLFGHGGPSAFNLEQDNRGRLAELALFNSRAFQFLVSLRVGLAAQGRKNYDIGVIQLTPVPVLSDCDRSSLADAARRGWRVGRSADTTNETSHAFLLPSTLCARLSKHDPSAIEADLARIQAEIDGIAFELYGFSKADRLAASGATDDGSFMDGNVEEKDEYDVDNDGMDANAPTSTDALLSWAVGVTFGRFDWRLATGERQAPPEPEPFDPLPTKSPGMLPDGATPFHDGAGILVDDPGHRHDLAHIVEEVLERVSVSVPSEVRRWLQKDFFPFHLQCYSKSRRKAPIYWPLSTESGSYTLWIYYPSLNSQTLYTAINEFVEPKLIRVRDEVAALRNKGATRTRDDERKFELSQAFELELIKLRDAVLKLAPTYKPNQDDGVQINAAPLWSLFRHKPWQRVLKDTWTKLEKGEYDWARLAMSYWPDRVREKCNHDESLAIAHGLEHLEIESEATSREPRDRNNVGSDE